jgi:hypothetical protein
MHPAIRLASFIILVIGLAMLDPFILASAIISLTFLCQRYCVLKAVLPLLKRLRWLFLSLFILNLWFNAPEFTWLPEITGLIIAIKRTTILIIIVLAAHLLVITTSTDMIIATLNWWFLPIKKLGFPTEKLAVRLALVLDTLEAVKNLYPQQQMTTTVTYHPLKKISDSISQLFVQTFIRAESEPLRKLEIPALSSPPVWQWSYPFFLILLITIGS